MIRGYIYAVGRREAKRKRETDGDVVRVISPILFSDGKHKSSARGKFGCSTPSKRKSLHHRVKNGFGTDSCTPMSQTVSKSLDGLIEDKLKNDKMSG